MREAAGMSHADVDARDLSELFHVLERQLGPKLGQILNGVFSDPERIVILVNGRNLGRRLDPGHILHEGDEIAIFPPVSGG